MQLFYNFHYRLFSINIYKLFSSPFTGIGTELCSYYVIPDAADFVEQWTTYSVNNLNGAEPSVLLLLEFERKVLQSKKDKLSTPSRAKYALQDPCSSSKIKSLLESEQFFGYAEEDQSVLGAYLPRKINSEQDDFLNCLTPKVSYIFTLKFHFICICNMIKSRKMRKEERLSKNIDYCSKTII